MEKRVAGYILDRWYDRNARSWVVQTKDLKGNQIGKATYVGSAREAVREYNTRKTLLELGYAPEN